MNTVTLGKSGLEVSEIGFGGIPIMRVAPEEAHRIIRHCFDLGIRFFDTAHVYGDSEEKLGLALEPFRERVVIATKVWAKDGPGAERQLEESFKRLRTDRIDLIQCHNVSSPEAMDEVMGPGGAFEVLSRAKSGGRVSALGFSSHNPDVAVRMCGLGSFDTLQFPFNFIEDDPLERVFPAALEQGMGIIGMKPLGGGLLEKARLCFRFLQQHPEVVPIPGIQAPGEIDEIAALYRDRAPLSPADLEAISDLRKELGNRFCHRCEYCMPCEQGVMIAQVMLVRTQIRRFRPDMLIAMAREAVASVENCTECGECLERCPYGLPIPELIRENRDLYEKFAAGRRPA